MGLCFEMSSIVELCEKKTFAASNEMLRVLTVSVIVTRHIPVRRGCDV